MSALAAPTSQRRNHERRDPRQQARTEALIRFSNELLDRIGANRSASWVSRTVRAYSHGRHGLFGTFLLDRLEVSNERRETDPELAYLLAYSDPTGETAVRNVMRGRR